MLRPRWITVVLVGIGLSTGIAVGLNTGVARADVAFPEPNSQTLAQSSVIALARLADTEGSPPFSNLHPPTLIFEVTRPIRGAKIKDRLRVIGFTGNKPVVKLGTPPDPAVVAANQKKWEHSAPPIPPASEDVLLFLDRDPGADTLHPVRGAFGGLVYFTAPDDEFIKRVIGMTTFSLESVDGRDLTRPSKGPLKVKLLVTNLTGSPVRFDQRSIRIFGHLPPAKGVDRDLAETPPPVAGNAVIPLGPHKSKTIEWDLKKLFPGQFEVPGMYWLRVKAPASCGLLDQLDLNIDLKE